MLLGRRSLEYAKKTAYEYTVSQNHVYEGESPFLPDLKRSYTPPRVSSRIIAHRITACEVANTLQIPRSGAIRFHPLHKKHKNKNISLPMPYYTK